MSDGQDTTDSTDRRVRRTRTSLHQALIELMLDRAYDRITVRDILDRADVGRSTFYAHYRDKDDLLLRSSTDYLRAAMDKADAGTDAAEPLAPVRTLFRLAADNPEVYRALLGRKSGTVLLRTTRVMVGQILAERLGDRLAMPEDEFTTTVTFLSWGVVGMLGAIAEPHPPLSAEEAYQHVVELVGPGLTSRVRGG
ncbi:TetR/AcrR family transcriptional regulator [Nocardia sp. NBC_00508]|uniref:TetR/AcrR family transcriptional regulator n=1 Tax=Nocardia sp. NBC_00508 TaxID=2975992 RepID=UPI002E821565|nr:TetR/AcrR family transcriptional regulator [Nocardia sp. NBC_00508]WUD69344.1 TetR/AcrR family transcriptional regulator [Nocardia sp. NBC_00508]